MSPFDLALAAAVLAVGGLLQGSIGFGSMIVAAPVLILIEPTLVPAPAIVAATALVMLIAWRDRASIEARGVGWTILGRVPGTVLGGAAVALLSQTALEFLFGALLLLGVLLSARRLHLERTPALLFGAGALSGFMGTATAVGGPPLALVYQREAGPIIRGTLNGIFVIGSAFSLVTLAAVGELGVDELNTGLAISPGIILGFALSRPVASALDARSLRPAILAFAGLAAVAVLVRAAW